MIKIEFADFEIEQLFDEKEKNTHHKVRKKAEVLYLKSLGHSHFDIQGIARITRPTLAKYLHDYKINGIESVTEVNFYKPKSELDKFIPELKIYFDKNPPCSSAEAQMIIEDKTGIRRSPTQIREFLKRMGMKIRKVGYVPGKSCDEEKQREQEEFLKKNLNQD